MISVLGFTFCSKNISALRASDNGSALEYICCPSSITAYLRESELEDWECAKLKFLSNGTLRVKILKNGFKGEANFPPLGTFFEPIVIRLDQQKPITLSDLSIHTEDERVIDCSFFMNCEKQNYEFKFLSTTNEIRVLKNGKLHKFFELHEEWQSSYAQIIGLGMSIITQEII